MVNPRESAKCPLACEYCRAKKAKCNGGHPCGNCIDHNVQCVFPDRRQRTRKRKEREQEMEDRLARMEVLLRTAVRTGQDESSSDDIVDEISVAQPDSLSRSDVRTSDAICDTSKITEYMPTGLQDGDVQVATPSPCPDLVSTFPDLPPYTPALDCTPRVFEDAYQRISETAGNIDQPSQNRLPMPVSPPSTAAAGDCVPHSCPSQPKETIDQQGCASYLSICTIPAVEWISTKVGMPDFLTSARRLSKKVLRREHLDRGISTNRTPEPDLKTALEWSKSYFENCLDSVFDVVSQDEFESHLTAYYQDNLHMSSGKSWYALRNTIYASGCRSVLCQAPNPAAFSDSRVQAWKYFENALSVHTDLLYVQSDLVSIQALVLMAFHAEALGTPALEYMLLSSATRLAHAMGLHLMSQPYTSGSNQDAYSRHRLWWTLYSYEKHLAYRSGRPTAIDDDYISCPIPTSLRRGSATSLEFVTKTIAHSQISSLVAKQLNTAKSMNEPPESILGRVQSLDARLREWRETLDPIFRTQPPFIGHSIGPNIEKFFILYLHFSYWSLIIAIHGVFCYPWNRPDIYASTNQEIHLQIQRSTDMVAEASRQIILATQRLEITAALPVWLTFYFPMVGMINLFVCVLKNPFAPSTASDLSLMDIVIGHFGYLEFISSSELEFPFPREIAAHARSLVKKAKDGTLDQTSTGVGSMQPDSQPPQMMTDAEMNSFQMVLGLEDWCTFLPSVPQIGTMPFNLLDGDGSQFLQANPPIGPDI